MAKDYDKEDGVWRTIGGRKVFIRKGQNLADAMIESGKFKTKGKMRESYRKAKEEDKEDEISKLHQQIAKLGREPYEDDIDQNRLNEIFDKQEQLREKIRQKNLEGVTGPYDKKANTEQDRKSKAYDKEYGKAYPYREQYKQEGKEDLESKKGWLDYRNRYQESINRSTNPDNRKKYVEERDMAEKYYNDARERLNEKADEILGKQDKIKKDLKEANDGELNDLSKGWAKLSDSNGDSEIEQKEIKRLAKKEIKDRKEKDFKEEDKLYDKMSNLGSRTDENANDIDNAKQEWLNKYRENTNKYSQKERRERKEKETDTYDDPESEESQRLQDIQSRYDEYLQKTEGRGASYGEIAYVDSLRGKDLDDFEKELDDYFEGTSPYRYKPHTLKNEINDDVRREINGYLDDRDKNEQEFGDRDEFYNYMNKNWYNVDKDKFDKIFDEEESKRNKSTNETMNQAIREKASKKKEIKQDLPKATEIKEQGTSNRKEVSENIQAHILDHYDSPEDFIEQMDAYDWKPTNWHRGEALAEDGFYEIYYDDQRKFLDSLKINPKGKDFDDDRVFQTYKSLIGRESAKLYDRIKRNQYNQYKKDHPLTKMTFEDFKDMNKK